jgi:hypothetical protein
MEGTGMVYRPLCVAILPKYFSENKVCYIKAHAQLLAHAQDFS